VSVYPSVVELLLGGEQSRHRRPSGWRDRSFSKGSARVRVLAETKIYRWSDVKSNIVGYVTWSLSAPCKDMLLWWASLAVLPVLPYNCYTVLILSSTKTLHLSMELRIFCWSRKYLLFQPDCRFSLAGSTIGPIVAFKFFVEKVEKTRYVDLVFKTIINVDSWQRHTVWTGRRSNDSRSSVLKVYACSLPPRYPSLPQRADTYSWLEPCLMIGSVAPREAWSQVNCRCGWTTDLWAQNELLVPATEQSRCRRAAGLTQYSPVEGAAPPDAIRRCRRCTADDRRHQPARR